MTSIPLLITFAAAAVLSAYELFRRGERPASYLADRQAHGAHVVMNAAMAAMVAPGYDATAERIVFWVLVLGGAVLIAQLAMAVRAGKPESAVASGYHALAMFAMVYAVVLMPAGMMHHGMDMPRPWIATVFAALFLIDGIVTGVAAAFFPGRLLGLGEERPEKRATAPMIADLRRSAIPHVVMDAGMAWMLL